MLERLKLTNARAIGLTEALLRLADANAVTAASEPVDLAAIAADAVADTADEAEGRGVTLEERLEPAQTVGDATLLAQLAANLVQNAVRHNVPGGHARVSTAGPVLRVTNSGRVYSPAEAARLVEPFLRGNGRTGGGHGLGLTLVARIAELHGGTLDVEARREGGLAVTVTLQPEPSASRSLIFPSSCFITSGSRSVVTSPSSRPSAMSRSSRRMILPERVLGRSSAQMIRLGRANLPIREATFSRISPISSSVPSRSPSSVTNAVIAWPVSSSAWPITAASATLPCETIADSTSAVESRCPETLTTSSMRPMIQT